MKNRIIDRSLIHRLIGFKMFSRLYNTTARSTGTRVIGCRFRCYQLARSYQASVIVYIRRRVRNVSARCSRRLVGCRHTNVEDGVAVTKRLHRNIVTDRCTGVGCTGTRDDDGAAESTETADARRRWRETVHRLPGQVARLPAVGHHVLGVAVFRATVIQVRRVLHRRRVPCTSSAPLLPRRVPSGRCALQFFHSIRSAHFFV